MQCTSFHLFCMSANQLQQRGQHSLCISLYSNWIICFVSFMTSQKLCSQQLGIFTVVLTKEFGQRRLFAFFSPNYPTFFRMFSLSQYKYSSNCIFLLVYPNQNQLGSLETQLALSSISAISAGERSIKNYEPLCEMRTVAVETVLKTWKVKDGKSQKSLGLQL